MEFFVILAVAACGLWFLFRKKAELPFALTRLLNVFEEIEATRHTMLIGAGGGLESLSPNRQANAMLELQRAMRVFERYPRHEVTREGIKTLLVCQQHGKLLRAQAADRMLNYLVEQNLAMELGAFKQSYC